MPTDDEAGSGNITLNADAKEIHNNIQTITNKPSNFFTKCNFNLQNPTTDNAVQDSSSQETTSSTTSCILREKLQELYQNYNLPKVAWLTEGCDLPLEKYFITLQLNESGQPIKIEEIFNPVKSKRPSRILIEGQPGYGKTTLATKLAFDWAKNKKYMDFKLVFLFPLRELRDQTINDGIIKMGNRCGLHEKEVMQTVNENKKDILFILDGLDELIVDNRHHVTEVLYEKQYSEVTVVVCCRTDSFKLSERERTELFGVTHAGDKFHDKQLTILGIQNWNNKILFLNNFTPLLTDSKIIRSILLQLDLFDSPLFLMMLPIIMNNDQNAIQISCKIDFYKQLFNCIIKHSCKNRGLDLTASFDLFHFDSSTSHIQAIVCRFGKSCLKKIITMDLQFESDDLTEEIYNLGLLSRHTKTSLFYKKNHYEAFHLSIMEFAAAFALWMDFKFDKPAFTKTLLQPIVDHFIEREGTSLVLPFLASLMGFNLDELLLKIHQRFSRQNFRLTLKLLAECSTINIAKSSNVYFFFPSDFNFYRSKFNDVNNCREILTFLTNCYQIKQVCINTTTQLEILPTNEVSILLFLLRLRPHFVIQVSTAPHQNEEIVLLSNFPTPEEIKRSLDYVMSLESQCVLRLINGSDLSAEFLRTIAETKKYNRIKYQYLGINIVSEFDKQVIEKLLHNNQVQFLWTSGHHKFQVEAISCAMSHYLTSIEMTKAFVDLYDLTNGGRKEYKRIILIRCTVTCKRSLLVKNHCDYLELSQSEIFSSNSVTAIVDLEPCKLKITDINVMKLYEKCPTWTGFHTVKQLSLKLCNEKYTNEFLHWKNLETLYIHFRHSYFGKIVVEHIQKLKISKLIIKAPDFHSLKIVESVSDTETNLKEIDLFYLENKLNGTLMVDKAMEKLECHYWDKVNLIFRNLIFAENIVQKLTRFIVSYRSYGSDVDDPEEFKIKYQYEYGFIPKKFIPFEWIVLSVIRRSNDH